MTTSISSTNVTISWVAPDDNSQAITSYTIQIEGANGLFVANSACPGTDPTITYCDVPMTTLISTY